jgi:hypothetical protein
LNYRGSHDLVKICSRRIKWCQTLNTLFYIHKNKG